MVDSNNERLKLESLIQIACRDYATYTDLASTSETLILKRECHQRAIEALDRVIYLRSVSDSMAVNFRNCPES